jgi:hypothetical protein
MEVLGPHYIEERIMKILNNIETPRVYELVLTLQVTERSVNAARSAANDHIKEEGLAAGFLQVFDKGAEGVSTGRMVYNGPGGSYATLDCSATIIKRGWRQLYFPI